MRTILITGAGGFLGSICCSVFSRAGYNVRALVRDPDSVRPGEIAAGGGIYPGGIYRCLLPDQIDKAAFQGPVHALVHCAYTTSGRPAGSDAVNIEGTQRLRQLCREHGVERFVFISSLAAHPEAVSRYGSSKWRIEQTLQSAADAIVKPGVIIGSGGVFERTRGMIAKLPIVPVIYPDRQLQTIWIEDAAQGILETVRRAISGTIILASPQPVRMSDFYRRIAALDGRRKRLIPIPGDAALAVVKVLEGMGLHLPINSENLLGIRHLRFFDPQPDLERLGLAPLSFEESLARLKGRSPG